MQNTNIVIGYFREQSQAEKAISDLKNAGFTRDQIGFASPAQAPEESRTIGGEAPGSQKSGSIWDKITAFFEGGDEHSPGSLDNRAIEGNNSYDYEPENFRGSLGTLGIPEKRARYFEYQLGTNQAGALVTVQAQGREQEAEQILNYNGGDIGQNAASFQYPTASAQSSKTGRQKIQLLGEVLRVHKERVAQGEVRLRKEVVTEQQNIEVPVTREELVIERHPGSEATPAGEIGADSEIRIPLTEERVSVEKRPTVREEIEVGKRGVEETQQVSDQVRREELRVEKDGKIDVKGETDSKTSRRKTA
jgi:uncharacterized protein (TIGR02271 family)